MTSLPSDLVDFTLAEARDAVHKKKVSSKELTIAFVKAVADARSEGKFQPEPADDAIHFTVLPWASFTSFSHARNWGREDSVPKIAFGKFTEENQRTKLPISVEVHHALMDGLHVGRYLSLMQETLLMPESYVRIS